MNILSHRKESDPKESHAIVSGDTDFIPMVLSTEKCNVYLFLPSIPDSTLDILSKYTYYTKPPCKFSMFSKQTFIEVYVPKQYTKRVCLDIALLCILGGNDFLPTLEKCPSFGDRVNCYFESGKFLLNYSSGVVK
jgi:hypothetical protein